MNQNSYVHKDGKNNGKRNTLPRMFSWLWKSGTINVWPFSFFNGTYWNIKITKSKNVKIGNYISIYCYSIHCQQKSQGSKQYNNKLLNKYDTKVCENNNPFLPPTLVRHMHIFMHQSPILPLYRPYLPYRELKFCKLFPSKRTSYINDKNRSLHVVYASHLNIKSMPTNEKIVKPWQ